MKFSSKTIGLKCGQSLMLFINPFVVSKNPKLPIDEIVHELNTFLDVIYHILNPKNKYTLTNYKIRGEYLLAFSMLYQYLVINGNCKSESNKLIGFEKSWTKFLCTTTKNNIPIVHLYKVLAMLALIYADCYNDMFYIKDTSNKNKEPNWLDLKGILDNLYNPNIRFSKSKSNTCLNSIEPSIVVKINNLLNMSIYVRQHYLDNVFCGTMVKTKPDIEHENFLICTKELQKTIVKYHQKYL